MSYKIGDTYEWIKGPDFGKSDVVKTPSRQKGAVRVIEFASGRSCNVAIAREYLSILASAEESDMTGQEILEAELQKLGKSNNPAPTKLATKPIAPELVPVTPAPEVKDTSMYRDLLDNIKKYKEVNTDISLTLDLPSLDVIQILLDSYGDDMKDELRAYLIEKVLTDELKAKVESIVNNWMDNIVESQTLD